MMVLAIDPGSSESAYLIYDPPPRVQQLVEFGKIRNEEMIQVLLFQRKFCGHLAIEMVQSFGMPVGEDVFETVLWTGRFVEAWGGDWSKVYRSKVKEHLCHSHRARDSNIRQALLDRFEQTGGGKTPQIGVKNRKGPLFGVKRDIWSALAIAITWSETGDNAKQ